MNENRTLPPIAPRQVLQKGQVGFGVEYAVPQIMKPYLPQFDGAEDLSLPGNGDLGRMADAAPGGVQGGILAEAGFIREN